MSREQETKVLDRTYEVIKSMSGKRHRIHGAMVGAQPQYRRTVAGTRHEYDSSMMEDDYHPYYLRVGDSWTKIDYAKKARNG